MFSLTFENFKIKLYIILNQKFTSIYKLRFETAIYSYQLEKKFEDFLQRNYGNNSASDY